jgi:GTP-binding protein
MTQLRNVALVAHVDHGKTSLVDQMLRQSGVFRENQEVTDLVMDSGDLERERGITILAKNTAIHWGDTKINIVDTPGHADFGGEVERVLHMVDGVLLLVDAFEGPMAQTRFVLSKAFDRGLKPIVVVNKMDRPGARPHEVLDEVLNLFCEFDLHDHQLDFSVVYAAGRDGWAVRNLADEKKDLGPLFDTIVNEIPGPKGDPAGAPQFSVAAIDYDPYVGTTAIGRVRRGTLKKGESYGLSRRDGTLDTGTIEKLFVYDNMGNIEVEEVAAGEICTVVGLGDVSIGDTVTEFENPDPIPVPPVEQPTLSTIFTINASPLAGQEGKHVQSRKLRERLFRATRSDVALKVEETDSADQWRVSGRGTLHLGILVERLRREDFEFAVGKPLVIMRGKEEPLERVFVSVPEEHASTVVSLILRRKGELVSVEQSGSHAKQEFIVPSRGLIGLRTRLLTATRGEAVLTSIFHSYGPHRGTISHRANGVQISMDSGKAITFSLNNLRDRGTFFVKPQDPIYEGQVVGENCRPGDIVVNPCKKKPLTNIRASGSDDNVVLTPPRVFSVEEALEYIESDELLEVTPTSLRMRKRILKESMRRKTAREAGKR